jgi:hypothetical protein
MRARYLLPMVALATALAGCGTMQVTAADPSARLYAGGRMLGRGHGEIKRRGTPETTIIIARTDDGRRSQTTVKREFTAFTFFTGLFTYGICLFACWEYPSAVFVALPAQTAEPNQSTPAGNADDLWLSPPAGWQPKGETSQATPPPPPAPTPAPGVAMTSPESVAVVAGFPRCARARLGGVPIDGAPVRVPVPVPVCVPVPVPEARGEQDSVGNLPCRRDGLIQDACIALS